MRPSLGLERQVPPWFKALASALLLILAMPGLTGWWPCLFFALTPLFAAVRNLKPKKAVWTGFFWGCCAFCGLLYWVLIVLGRYGGLPLRVSLPALLLLAAYMALYPALCCGLLAWLHQEVKTKSGAMQPCALIWAAPFFWTGLDSLRATLFSGFPWMDLGYGLYRQPLLIQAADLGGHHLLTFTLVLCNSLLAFLLAGGERKRRSPPPGYAVAAFCFIAAIVCYSLLSYQSKQQELAQAPRISVAIAQGNIDQAEKWSFERKASTVANYLELSARMARQGAQLLIWPETALPFYPQQDPLTQSLIRFSREQRIWLLTGAPMYEEGEENQVDLRRYYNAALLLNPQGRMDGIYAKQHLVPFGEYVPLRRYLPFLEPLVVNVGDFTAGTNTQPLEQGAARLGMLICYESIFPAIAQKSVAQGANLLINLTNDAWYGRSSAPYQSLAMTTLRAVENQRALVRAANTGISGFIDPLGGISQETSLFTKTAALEQVPLLTKTTCFTRLGHYFGWLCVFVAGGMLLLLWLLRSRRSFHA